MKPIFLLSDFSDRDVYVGVVKAVIQRLAPGAPVIDLCHQIPPFDILGGTIRLEDAWPYLPRPCVVCAIVDPGVGGPRRGLIACCEHHTVIGPDNGLLTPWLRRAEFVRELIADEDIQPHASATFHGRDVFGPAAAKVARGDFLQSFSKELDSPPVLNDNFLPWIDDHQVLHLKVVAVDVFGNVALNLRREDVASLYPWLEEEMVELRAGSHRIVGLSRTFSDALPGKGLILWNSADRLEIAVCEGNAKQAFALRIGDEVLLSRLKSRSEG
jgi:S-adenosyl-L-methionine hydrolase (adenosine-forming)